MPVDYSTQDPIEEHKESRLSNTAALESILFISPNPLSISQLSSILDIPPSQVQTLISQLQEDLKSRGIRIQNFRGKYTLTTAPETSAVVEKLLNLEAESRLSKAALEVLAILAYKQPITRPEIDAIRGVNSDGVIRTLIRLGLIEEIGRAESPGRPIIYAVTPEFLNRFGISSLDELPPLEQEFPPSTELTTPDELIKT